MSINMRYHVSHYCKCVSCHVSGGEAEYDDSQPGSPHQLQVSVHHHLNVTVCHIDEDWCYSGYSIEAVRFTEDSVDILMGGCKEAVRGEYIGTNKLFDIRADGGEKEGDGDLLCKSKEIT